MTGIQNEYRFKIPNSKFRLVAFAGIAKLSGGSYGEGDSSRHDDDDDWYSADGVGVRYALHQKTGLDLRFDFITTNERDESVYLMLNQTF